MRVLQVTVTYYPELQFGGPPQKVHALSCGLVKRGHQVQVITFHSAQPFSKKQFVVEGVEIQYLPWLGKGAWQWPRGLNKLAAAVRQADIVHCYGLYNLLCPAAAFFAIQHKRPFLLEPLGMYVPRAGRVRLKRLYHYFFTSWMIGKASKVIATAPNEADELSDLVEAQQLLIRRNGIDIASFQNLPTKTIFRNKYRIKENEKVILYLGRISPIKNLEELIIAFTKANLKDTRLILVGPMLEPDYAKRLHHLIMELALSQQVLLVGPLYDDDKLAAFAAADLFVLPSIYESFGNVAAEAVAAGLPVLLTKGCGIAPLIDGRAGLAVSANATALAAGLRLFFENPAQREMLTNQREEVLKELSWNEPLNELEKLYKSIIG